MTLLQTLKEYPKLEKARYKPFLSFTECVVPEILSEVKSCYFPHIKLPIELLFAEAGPLTCIYLEPEQATIFVHAVLNHWETPPVVFRHICKHELLHLDIPPKIIDGKEDPYPPEFWKRERAISPEGEQAWRWVWTNLEPCLKLRPRLQRIEVLPTWKQVWNAPRRSLLECEVSLPSASFASSIEASW